MVLSATEGTLDHHGGQRWTNEVCGRLDWKSRCSWFQISGNVEVVTNQTLITAACKNLAAAAEMSTLIHFWGNPSFAVGVSTSYC